MRFLVTEKASAALCTRTDSPRDTGIPSRGACTRHAVECSVHTPPDASRSTVGSDHPHSRIPRSGSQRQASPFPKGTVKASSLLTKLGGTTVIPRQPEAWL